MSDSRQAAWRRRRSSSVSRNLTTRTSRSVHPISSWAWRAERDSSSFSVLRGADQSVLGALGLRQLFVQQAFAHAEGREHDGLRLCDADDVFEHQSRIGQQRPAGVGDDFDIGQHVGRREAAQAPCEIERVRCRDRIAVHHPQRIAALDDVDARQRPPCSSDRIEAAAAAGLELGDAGKIRLDDALGALKRFMRQVLQRQASERQRHAAANAVAVHVDQFQRAAAEIADDAVRVVDAGNDAERG